MVAERRGRVNNAQTKLNPSWNGPYQILEEVSPLVYRCCLWGYDSGRDDLPRGVLQEVHVERIALFSSSEIWTEVDVDELERSAQHDARSYEVRGIAQWRRQDRCKSKLEFRVKWRGFEDPRDDSWEPEEAVLVDPVLLRYAIDFCEKRQQRSGDCRRALKRLKKESGEPDELDAIVGEVEYVPTN